jgi:uncharacterized protein YuzE
MTQVIDTNMQNLTLNPLVKTTVSIALLAVLTACSSNKPEQHSTQLCKVDPAPLHSEFSVSGLKPVATFASDSPFDSSAAEIVSYDSCSDLLFVVNAQAKTVEVLAQPNNSIERIASLDLSQAGDMAGISIGAANSVATFEGLVAVAIEHADKQSSGIIALYDAHTLTLLTTFDAGALPDMVSFSKDGVWIASANEGEPSGDYERDPEGSVTLVNIANGWQAPKVVQIDFRDFNQNGHRHNELSPMVRLSGPNATVAQDLEPEYLSFADNGKLYVSLQENNAIAKIDVEAATVDAILPLGTKSWTNLDIDASNKDKKVANFKQYPMLESYFMPDSISSFTVDGNTYIATANEGDGREYLYDSTRELCETAGHEWDDDICLSHIDEVRGAKLDISSDHPLYLSLQDNALLGRLKFISPNRTIDASEPVVAFGGRSFSIWDEDGKQVFDSGDQFAHIVAQHSPGYLNSSNDSNQSADDRSDDKGVEPEAITTATINDRVYAFIGLERQGGIMVYDVTSPSQALFVHYTNRRDFAQPVCTVMEDDSCVSDVWNPASGDLGPESIEYFTRMSKHYIAVGNEVSGTTTVYELQF